MTSAAAPALESSTPPAPPIGPVVDCDSHLTEPPDLWRSRLPAKWHEVAPRVEWHEPTATERWRIGDRWTMGVGSFALAGWPEAPPSVPARWEQVSPQCYDPTARAGWMDRNGITAQVLYPNVVAFEGHALMAYDDPALALACIQAQNDHMVEFADQQPGRYVPLTNLPFWDLDASIAEMERGARRGVPGVVWAATLDRHGLPATTDPHWDRFYAAAQDLGQSISFHVGVGLTADVIGGVHHTEDHDVAATTYSTTMGFMNNARMIAKLILHGVCERFPRLQFVSVESGFGYVPFVIESLDWQWRNNGGARVRGRLLPSEYFRRQVHAMFWYEQDSLSQLPLYADNVLFETDFPHATSLTPGPGSASPSPAALVAQARRVVGAEVMDKVQHRNAAALYRLDPEVLAEVARRNATATAAVAAGPAVAPDPIAPHPVAPHPVGDAHPTGDGTDRS